LHPPDCATCSSTPTSTSTWRGSSRPCRSHPSSTPSTCARSRGGWLTGTGDRVSPRYGGRVVTSTLLAYLHSPDRGVWMLGPVPIRAYAVCIIAGIVVAVLWGEKRFV